MENNISVSEQAAENQTTAEDTLAREDYKRIIENLLFITDRPLSAAKISQLAEVNNVPLTREIIAELQQDFADTSRAIQILEIGGGFQMSTKPEYGRWVRKLFNEKMSTKLSPAALETLAIIAYKQPVTRAEIEAIRGVDIVAPLEKIMERGLVRVVGKKDTPGKPMVYGTTDEFLRLFGLNKISELPEIETFSNKGLKEIQSDLPFSETLPDLKDNIIPLTEEEALIHNYSLRRTREEIFDKDGNETAYTEEVVQTPALESEQAPCAQEDLAQEQPAALPGEALPTDNGQEPSVESEQPPVTDSPAAEVLEAEAPSRQEEETVLEETPSSEYEEEEELALTETSEVVSDAMSVDIEEI